MPSYGNFQSDNAKYAEKNRDNYNPEFNPTVKAKTQSLESIFDKNLHKWVDFISWCRWESDGLLDLLKPPKGGITLHFDQRVFIRSIMRFFSVYGVFPRGFSKTYLEILCLMLVAMLYPNIELALTAQTKENGAKFLSDKYSEITRHYPILKNEVIKTNFSKDGAEILFVNNSVITNLANSQSAKGQRRKRINIEESALLNNAVFEDALQPVVEVPRNTIGKLAIVNPEELNQQINFFTTSGFRNSDEWFRSLKMIEHMVNLEGEIVLGSNWMLACWYGRGSSKEQILKKKKTMSSVAFAQNYNSSWVGATDGALVDVNKLLACRNLIEAEFEYFNGYDYVLGIDVARSQKSTNNRSSVAVIKIQRNLDNTVRDLSLVNLFVISNALTFDAQAIEVKKIQKCFNAKMCIIDINGLGVGLLDCLLKTTTDPKTGETYKAWNTINTDHLPENEDCLEIIYALTPQSSQSRITVNFMDLVESGRLRLLEKRDENSYSLTDKNWTAKFAPYLQTDNLVEEATNLKLKHLNNGGLTIEKVLGRIDKDRYSSVAYGLWWVMEFDNQVLGDTNTMLDFMVGINGGSFGNKQNSAQNFINKIFK